ncbi:MAG: transglycosylase SLT domain-containing protein [Candidatus Competibacteraceae bacterium]
MPAALRLSRTGENNRQRYTPDVNRIAAQYRLDPALMHAVISAESSYPLGGIPKGAMGLMQLMPGTAERFGVSNAYDPVANMHGGARYLRWLRTSSTIPGWRPLTTPAKARCKNTATRSLLKGNPNLRRPRLEFLPAIPNGRSLLRAPAAARWH